LIEHLLLVLKKLYKAHFLLHRSREKLSRKELEQEELGPGGRAPTKLALKIHIITVHP
jgi:hypothetical protein